MEALAFAKLNLTLEVLGRRADGYHEVRTILQTIDLADRLEIQPYPTLRVECDDPALNGEANLVWRAAMALARCHNVPPQAAVFIQKHIPVGMGLGGGSSDAAAALVALNQLWGLALGLPDLAQVAAGVGSDVPFFLWGGTALAEGRGERIQPLPSLPRLPVTLVCPSATIPHKTARLYSCLTPTHYSDGAATRRMVEHLDRGQFSEEAASNVFEEVAFSVFPRLGELRRRLEASLGRTVHLSGSGPALFGIPSSEAEYRRVVDSLPAEDARVYLVHTAATQPVGI